MDVSGGRVRLSFDVLVERSAYGFRPRTIEFETFSGFTSFGPGDQAVPTITNEPVPGDERSPEARLATEHVEEFAKLLRETLNSGA